MGDFMEREEPSFWIPLSYVRQHHKRTICASGRLVLASLLNGSLDVLGIGTPAFCLDNVLPAVSGSHQEIRLDPTDRRIGDKLNARVLKHTCDFGFELRGRFLSFHATKQGAA